MTACSRSRPREVVRRRAGGPTVSFDVDAGEMLALIGPNGAGKTTCFNMLNGQLAPDAGIVRLDGRELIGLAAAIWRLGVGRTFQITATFASLTVRENVQMALLSHAGRVRACWRRAARCTRRGRRAARPASACSTRPSALRRAGLRRPEARRARDRARQPAAILLMDEPTAGMAPKERDELMALTAGSRASAGDRRAVHRARHGRGVRHADRIIVLDRGRLIAEGTPARCATTPRCARSISAEDAFEAARSRIGA